MDLYASVAMTGMGYALTQQRDNIKPKPVNRNEMSSMKNMYQSDYYNETRKEELQRGTKKWIDSQNPLKTGVIPQPAYASMFNETQVNNNSIVSLSGQVVNKKDFIHNNMEPFFKGEINEYQEKGNESLFNNKLGTNSYYKNKQEVPAFFEPTGSLTNIYGAQDQNDFYRSRTQVPTLRNNDFPIQQIKVGPGLGKGFTADPSGGVQQANMRDFIMPKTVDELRTATNPKISYSSGPLGPNKSIDKRPVITPFDKNRTETFYEQNSNMLFKTLGAFQKEYLAPNIEHKPTSRQQTQDKEYKGYANAVNKGEQGDFGKSSITIFNNARETTETKTVVTNITSYVKSLVSPLVDIVRHNLKEFTIDSAREYGTMQAQIPYKASVYDPVNHIMKTTIKETTIHDTTINNLTGPERNTVPIMDTAKTTVRETVDNIDTTRNVNSKTYACTVYDADIIAKKTIRETTQTPNNLYGFLGGSITNSTGSYNFKGVDIEVKDTQKQYTSDNDYYGGGLTQGAKEQISHEDQNNAQIDATRETIQLDAGEYVAPGSGDYESVNVDMINADTRKLIGDVFNAREIQNIDRVSSVVKPIEDCEVTSKPTMLNANEDRLDPNTLSSLNTNPYLKKINPILA